MRHWNIRARLLLLFTGIQFLFAFIFSASVYWFFTLEHVAEEDRNLRARAEALAAAYDLIDNQVRIRLATAGQTTLWPDCIAQIRTPIGQVLYQNLPGDPIQLPLPALDPPAHDPNPRFVTAPLPAQGTFRLAWLSDSHHGPTVIIAVASSLIRLEREQNELLRILSLATAAMIVVSVGVGWLVITRLLRPLGNLAAKARQITAERLDDRLTVHNPHDELGRLTVTLNEMIERLQASFDRIRRFTSDASHELRTPLTSMKSEIEVALAALRSPAEYHDLLGSILEEINRLTRLSDGLLTLARLDAGQVKLQREPLDLAILLVETVDRIQVQADARGSRLHIPPVLEPCPMSGNRSLLEQVLLNLLDNAIKHGGDDIWVDLHTAGATAVLTVRDSGTPIPPECLPRLFDRFYRLDASRSRTLGGAGLGLSLAKHIVELHGGRISAHSIADHGTTFEVFLPLNP